MLMRSTFQAQMQIADEVRRVLDELIHDRKRCFVNEEVVSGRAKFVPAGAAARTWAVADDSAFDVPERDRGCSERQGHPFEDMSS